MSQLVMMLAAMAALVAGSLAATSVVIEPIRPKGEEVALIFVPGGSIKGEAYRSTARAIQEKSPLRMWVALTGNYSSPLELPDAVEGAIRGLKASGMKSNVFVGIAHSVGGVFLGPYAINSPLKAVVLMGSYLTIDTKLRDYPKPVLTLSGELDGMTRITRIAVDYEQLQRDAKNSTAALYRTPVINIQGCSHAQFASGPLSPSVKKYDITPDITEKEAHAMIGKHVSSFVTVTFSSNPKQVKDAKQQLVQDFKDSSKRFQPLLDVKAMDKDAHKSSPWAGLAQVQFAGDLASKTTVNNKVMDTVEFLESKPSITKLGNRVVINTTASITYAWNPQDISLNMESPIEVAVKMKSRAAIKQALNTTTFGGLLGVRSADRYSLHQEDDDEPTCRSLNELALQIALQSSTDAARERYRKRGRPILFADDVVYGTGIQWSSTDLYIQEDDKGLHVQSPALLTKTTSFIYPGMHYCKVLSPYRAMEWINVDSLREKAPKSVA